MAESSPNGLKILWEKEKLLVTSNFSFSLSVFKRLVLQGLSGKGLTTELFSLTHYHKTILDCSKLKQIADNILKCI